MSTGRRAQVTRALVTPAAMPADEIYSARTQKAAAARRLTRLRCTRVLRPLLAVTVTVRLQRQWRRNK